MVKDWKPPVSLQMVTGRMVMQGWNKEKIIEWWNTAPKDTLNPEYKKNMMQWLEENL